MKVRDRYQQLEDAWKARLEDKYINSTPLDAYADLNNFLGGIPKGVVIGVTSDANVGKTPFVKSIVYSTFRSKERNPNIQTKILYFLIEERKDKFIDRCFTHFYKERYNTILPYSKLLSNSKTPFTPAELKQIEELVEPVSKFIKDINLFDNLYDPDEIYDVCCQYLEKRGKIEFREVNKIKYIQSFKPHNPLEHYIIIVDHCNDLIYDGGFKAKHDALTRWCTVYSALNLSKVANATVINVLQQSLDKTQYTSKGTKIISKLEPSKEGLGDNKQIYRSLDILLGLFAPSFFQIEEYNNYDITQLHHNYRALLLLKNRDGKPRGTIDLILDSNTFKFTELPKASISPTGDITPELRKIYETYRY